MQVGEQIILIVGCGEQLYRMQFLHSKTGWLNGAKEGHTTTAKTMKAT